MTVLVGILCLVGGLVWVTMAVGDVEGDMDGWWPRCGCRRIDVRLHYMYSVLGLYVWTAWAAPARQAAGTAVLVGNGQWRSKGKKGPSVGRRVPPTDAAAPTSDREARCRRAAGRGPPVVALPSVGRPAGPSVWLV
jgi:hypothetical protein